MPPLEPFVRGRTAHYDPAWVSSDPNFGHAHITVLAPFLPPESIDADALTRLTEIATDTMPFAFSLARVETFPNGIIHLVPDPDEPFRSLTSRLCAAYPDYPPYAGRFPDPQPHLTLDARSAAVSVEGTVAALDGVLPVAGRADRIELSLWQENGCRLLASCPLGPGSPVGAGQPVDLTNHVGE